ncbi:hypothetical protein ACOSQ2_032608 [Xanthoceras sorbifolium]
MFNEQQSPEEPSMINIKTQGSSRQVKAINISVNFESKRDEQEGEIRIFKSTFDSISRPWDNPESVLEQVAKIKWDLPSLVQRYLPRVSTIPLHQGMCWEPTWKAIPNMAFFSDYMIRGAHVKREIGR